MELDLQPINEPSLDLQPLDLQPVDSPSLDLQPVEPKKSKPKNLKEAALKALSDVYNITGAGWLMPWTEQGKENLYTLKKIGPGIVKEGKTLSTTLIPAMVELGKLETKALGNLIPKSNQERDAFYAEQGWDAPKPYDGPSFKDLNLELGKTMVKGFAESFGYNPNESKLLDPRTWQTFQWDKPDGTVQPSYLRKRLEEAPITTLLDWAVALNIAGRAAFTAGKASGITPLAEAGIKAQKATRLTKYPEYLRRAMANSKIPEVQTFALDTRLASKTQSMLLAAKELQSAKRSDTFNRISRYIQDIPEIERGQFAAVTMGLAEVPANVSPQFTKAIRLFSKLGAQERAALTAAGNLSDEAADLARWKPVVAKKFNKPIEIVTNESEKAKYADALALTPTEFKKLASEIRTEMKMLPEIPRKLKGGERLEPSYFPLINTETQKTEGYISSLLKNYAPEFLKKRTGASVIADSYLKDPELAWNIHRAQWIQLETTTQMLDKVKTHPLVIPYVKGMPVDKTKYSFFAPDDYVSIYRKQVDHQGKFIKYLEQYGDADEAARLAASDILMPSETVLAATKSKVYLIPKPMANMIDAVMTPGKSKSLSRVVGDQLTDIWKAAVLQGRPKWILTNILGNTLFNMTGGTPLDAYAKAFDPDYIKNLPKYGITDAGAMKALAPQVGQRLQDFPILKQVGQYTDFMRKANVQVENAYRTASFIGEAEKLARQNLVKTSASKFFTAQEVAKEVARMKTARPDQIAKAINHTDEFLNNYSRLQSWQIGGKVILDERKLIRPVVPFYSFLKHQLTLDAKMLGKYQGRTDFINKLEKFVLDQMPDDLKREAKQGGVFIGEVEEQVPGTDLTRTVNKFVDTQFLNPFVAGTNILAMVHPLIQIAVEWQQGKSIFSGKEFQSPFVLKNTVTGKYLTVDEKGAWQEISRPAGLGDVVKSKLPQVALFGKLHDAQQNKPIKSEWEVFSKKDLPETLLNWFIINTYRRHPAYENMKFVERVNTTLNAAINKAKTDPQFAALAEKNPNFYTDLVNKLYKDYGFTLEDQGE